MANMLKVLIVDPNSFFASGLRQVVIKHLQCKGVQVLFMKEQQSYVFADLIFWAPGYDSTIMPMGLLVGNTYKSRMIMIISHEKTHVVRHAVPQVFYRHQSHNVLLALIDQVLNAPAANRHSSAIHSNSHRAFEQLSPREWEVMCYVSKGKRLREIADNLNINVKTVSGHKRSAMGKLQLDRTIDLYHWLLSSPMAQVLEV
ncbi:Capsular synthesis regulator component B [Serratia fonticola]|uniref:LuxR C-terminal-related transcriptional regulator n=1 Tax=Serratia fonticola TaxID=47917 RepID=UPI00217740FB|nr:LuxR C-terminal-related transcriptional regulator [Serratia fonticola]CAI1948278.1 Capsular synthesis regulator component B [Serratia fonticola]